MTCCSQLLRRDGYISKSIIGRGLKGRLFRVAFMVMLGLWGAARSVLSCGLGVFWEKAKISWLRCWKLETGNLEIRHYAISNF